VLDVCKNTGAGLEALEAEDKLFILCITPSLWRITTTYGWMEGGKGEEKTKQKMDLIRLVSFVVPQFSDLSQ
jgi:hypothetical protein